MFMQENPGSVVTKYQFSLLFSKAWYKAIQPQNIISGFVKAGIHPFNPDAISVPSYPPGVDDNSDEESESDGEEDAAMNDNHGDGIDGEDEMKDPADDPDNSMSTSFSSQQIQLFTTRYENGYDIYTDVEYMMWLAETHPDALPDYANPEDYVPQQRSDPFQPFQVNDSVGDKQSDKDNSSHNGGEAFGKDDMETENSGVPCPDSLKSDDKEGDMETEESGAPCPDSLKADDSISQSTTPVSKNPETNTSHKVHSGGYRIS